MRKLIAVLNVIAWAGFWAFGYLAVSAGAGGVGPLVVAVTLAALGGAVGLVACLWLARQAEQSGYARSSNQLDVARREAAQAGHGAGVEG